MNYMKVAIVLATKANKWAAIKSWFVSDFKSDADRKDWVRSVLEEEVAANSDTSFTEVIEDDKGFKDISWKSYIKSMNGGMFTDPFWCHPQGLCQKTRGTDGTVTSKVTFYPNVIASFMKVSLLRSKPLAKLYIKFVVEHERRHAHQNLDEIVMPEYEDLGAMITKGLFESADEHNARPEERDANRAALRAVISSIRAAKKR